VEPQVLELRIAVQRDFLFLARFGQVTFQQLLDLTAKSLDPLAGRRCSQLHSDQRRLVPHPEPANKLSASERTAVLEACNSKELAGLPPSQIVPNLADQGRYLASESSLYRILCTDGQHLDRRACDTRNRNQRA